MTSTQTSVLLNPQNLNARRNFKIYFLTLILLGYNEYDFPKIPHLVHSGSEMRVHMSKGL